MKGLLIHIVLLFATINPFYGADLQVADSCINVWNNQKGLTPKEKCDLLYKIVANQSDDESCVYYSDILIKEAENEGDTLSLFYGKFCKGQSLVVLQKIKESIPILYDALKLAKANKLKHEEAIVYYTLSNAYYYIDDHTNSKMHLRKAIFLFNENNETNNLANAHYQLGNIYYVGEVTDSALYFYKKAMPVFEKQNNTMALAYIRGNIGALQARSNQYDSARYNLLSAIHVLTNLKDIQAVINYYNIASKNELFSQNYSKALEYIEKAQKLLTKSTNPDRRKEVYKQLAKVYEATGQFEKAYHYQNEYYTLRDSLVNIDVVTELANLRTEFEVGQKQAEVDKLETLNRSKSRTVLIIIIGLVVVTILLVFVYFGYRQKVMLNRKLQKQQKILASSQIEMAEANSAKDRLFSVISHDLRGPVSSLSSLAKLIVQSINACRFKDAEELSVSMADTTQQVEFLLDNLLHWSISRQNLYKPRKEAFELNKLVQDVLKVYNQTAQAKNILLTYNPGYSRLTIQSDSNCWATIIRNLVNNAIKFTHVGGKVEISSLYNNGFVHLSVRDNGIGMNQKQIDELFNQNGKISEWGTQNEKGQGLGLCLVNDFVTMQDGYIEVHSELGQGSCFTAIIPANLISKEDHVELESETKAELHQNGSRNLRILP
jgi:signal transduction histidine kinase